MTALSATVAEVTAEVDAGNAGAVRRGDAVTVTLPDGRTARGRIAKVASVAKAGQEGEEATVGLSVALRDRRRGGLDGAPVTLSLATGAPRPRSRCRSPRWSPPVHRPTRCSWPARAASSPVTLGVSADGWVEVAGRGLTVGARVVVPR